MEKIIYLGSNKTPFEWRHYSELKKECKRYKIKIGHSVLIGDAVSIGLNVLIGAYASIADNAFIGPDVSIGSDAFIGSNSSIIKGTTLSDDTEVIEGTEVGSQIILNDDDTDVTSGYIDLRTNKPVIQLGCFVRFVEDWEKDWYSNNKEFPKGAPQTEARLAVYNLIKEELNKQLKNQ